MIEYTAMRSDEDRYLSEVRDLWQTVGPLMRSKAALTGGMQWKTVAEREYLYRYQPDPMTRKKKSTSLGPRGPETEVAYAEFMAERERVRQALDDVAPKLETLARLAKAFRLNRLPDPVADLLAALHEEDLLELAPLVGEHALRCLEVHFREFMPFASRGELQFLVPQEVELLQAMTKAFLRVDRNYQLEHGNVLRSYDGPAIRFLLQSDLVENAEAVLPDDHLEMFMTLLQLEPAVDVVLSKSGRLVPVATVAPALWAATQAMMSEDASVARYVAKQHAEVDEQSRYRLEELIDLLADGPDARGPRI